MFVKTFILSILFICAAIIIVPIYIVIAYLNLASALKVLTDCVYTIEQNQLIAGSNLGFQYFNFEIGETVRIFDIIPMIPLYHISFVISIKF